MNAHEYKTMYEVENEHWWYVGIHRLIFSTLTRLHKHQGGPAWSILDAGCGTGSIAKGLRKFGQVRAIDLSDLALQLSKSRGVTSIDVIYMVPEDNKALAEFYRVLKPNGTLIMNLPALEWLRGEHDLAINTIRRYAPKTLQAQLTHYGFSIEKMTFVNSLLFPLVAPYRLITNWLPKGGNGTPQSDIFLPSQPVNSVLQWVFQLESQIIPHVNFPIGMSLFVVASKSVRQRSHSNFRP
jgi:SAM-dependent methyltransferase